MRSDVAGALTQPAEVNASAAKDLPPDYMVLRALLSTANKLNFRTRGRGHDYLHKAIGFSNKGALALMAYHRKYDKINPPDDGTSLHEEVCPRAAEFTSTEDIARLATALDDVDWSRWIGYVSGAYAVLDEADTLAMRRFLEPRSRPGSAFRRINWHEALAGQDARDFLIRFCDPGRKPCAGTFNRNYEVVPGENCAGAAERSEAVTFERPLVCSDNPHDRRAGLIPPCRDLPRQ